MKIFGHADENTIQQMRNCTAVEPGARGVLCADNHLGYSMPIGGVVAYRNHVSPSAVGYDIGCGNYAVKLDVRASDVDVPAVMQEIAATISFGVGRTNQDQSRDIAQDSLLAAMFLDDAAACELRVVQDLLPMAAQQLGTVGSGNHYVDLFCDDMGYLWIGVHFGSRGFGHKIATYFLTAACGVSRADQSMMADPVMITLDSVLGADYMTAMTLAGQYAYAGREWVVNRVMKILGVPQGDLLDAVHNHHNFAWSEVHEGERLLVHRKGATPAFPGQRGFVGGSMGDDAVIIVGKESAASREALYSAMHGAGRAMSRSQAAGKQKRVLMPDGSRKMQRVTEGAINWQDTLRDLAEKNIVLVGGAADEAPGAYKRLPDVLAPHVDAGTIAVETVLHPIGVAMASSDAFDPYKD